MTACARSAFHFTLYYTGYLCLKDPCFWPSPLPLFQRVTNGLGPAQVLFQFCLFLMVLISCTHLGPRCLPHKHRVALLSRLRLYAHMFAIVYTYDCFSFPCSLTAPCSFLVYCALACLKAFLLTCCIILPESLSSCLCVPLIVCAPFHGLPVHSKGSDSFASSSLDLSLNPEFLCVSYRQPHRHLRPSSDQPYYPGRPRADLLYTS